MWRSYPTLWLVPEIKKTRYFDFWFLHIVYILSIAYQRRGRSIILFLVFNLLDVDHLIHFTVLLVCYLLLLTPVALLLSTILLLERLERRLAESWPGIGTRLMENNSSREYDFYRKNGPSMN